MGQEIRAEIETITPQKAAGLLGSMAHNRTVRSRIVARYAEDMRSGRWQLNGEPVIVDMEGKLRDGQHRMLAVIDAKVPVKMLVVRGVAPETMVTIDTGAARSYGDVLQLRGTVGHHRSIAAVARWWWLYEHTEEMQLNRGISHQELDAVAAAHPTIAASCTAVERRKTIKRHFAPSVMAFVHSYTSEQFDRELADLFMDEINDGLNLTEHSPIFLLRRRIIDQQGSARLPALDVLALAIKAWNAWSDGAKLQVLRWNRSGDAKEAFPRFGKTTPAARYSRRRRAQELGSGAA